MLGSLPLQEVPSEMALRIFKLVLVLLICAVPAMADSVYDVSGVVTIVGNNACGGPPCVETLAFSFQVDYQPLFGGQVYIAHVLPGSTINSFGPLGPFNSLFSPEDYFAFFNSAGDEIDINGPFRDGELPTVPVPNLIDADLYGCRTNTCLVDFGFPGFTQLPALGIFRGGSLQYTATAVPEGSTSSYLLVGVGLALLGMLARRVALFQNVTQLTHDGSH